MPHFPPSSFLPLRGLAERDSERPLLHAFISLFLDEVFLDGVESKRVVVSIDFQDSEDNRLKLQGSQLGINVWGFFEVIFNQDGPKIKLHALTVDR